MIIILFNVILGLKRGLIAEVLTILGLITAIFVAIFWYARLSEFIIRQLKWDHNVLNVISFILIFILIILLFRILENILNQITSLLLLGWIDNLGGALFGFIRGSLIIGLLLFILNFLPLPLEIHSQIYQSELVHLFLDGVINVYDFLKDWLPAHFQFDMNLIKEKFYTKI